VLRADREYGPEPGFLSACDDAMGTLPCSKTSPSHLRKHFVLQITLSRTVKSYHETLKVLKFVFNHLGGLIRGTALCEFEL